MILTCPQCNARFLIPDIAIGPDGRGVKCGKCAHQWFAPPPKETPKPEASKTETPAPEQPAGAPNFDQIMQETAAAPPALKPMPAGSNVPALRPRFPLKAALAACILLAAATAAGLADFAPRALGLPESHGLAFANVQLRAETGGHANLYTLEGNIKNTSATPHATPLVRLTLLDGNGIQLRHWWLPLPRGGIAPAEIVPFAINGLDIPKNQNLKLRLDMGNWLELALRPVQ